MLSAGVIPVRKEKGKTLYLLLRAYNYWDFPKGRVEADEDPWQTALRELREETGIAQIKKRLCDDFYETESYSKNKVARYYLAEVPASKVDLLPTEELGRPEHHEYRWVTADEARELLVPRVQAALKWADSKLS